MSFVFRRCLVGLTCALAVCQVHAADPPPIAPHLTMSFRDVGDQTVVMIIARTMAGWESLHFATFPPPIETPFGLPPGGTITEDDPVGDWVLTPNAIALSGTANNADDTITFTVTYPKNKVNKSDTALTFIPDDQGANFPPATPYTIDIAIFTDDPRVRSLTPVPEPSSAALVFLGLAALAYRSRAQGSRTPKG